MTIDTKAEPVPALHVRGRIEMAIARTEADLGDVAACMAEFLAWMRLRYSDRLWIIDKYFDPRAWDEELAALGRTYAPPGAVVLARVDGRRAGCVMIRDLGGKIAEGKRLFVLPAFHGLGLGRMLTQASLDVARERGFEKVRTDTGPLQPEAVSLFESIGFARIPPYIDYPDDLRRAMIFLECDLARSG